MHHTDSDTNVHQDGAKLQFDPGLATTVLVSWVLFHGYVREGRGG